MSVRKRYRIVARFHTLISRSIFLACSKAVLFAARVGFVSLRALRLSNRIVWQELRKDTGAIAHDKCFLTMEMGSVRGKRINTRDTISLYHSSRSRVICLTIL